MTYFHCQQHGPITQNTPQIHLTMSCFSSLCTHFYLLFFTFLICLGTSASWCYLFKNLVWAFLVLVHLSVDQQGANYSLRCLLIVGFDDYMLASSRVFLTWFDDFNHWNNSVIMPVICTYFLWTFRPQNNECTDI